MWGWPTAAAIGPSTCRRACSRSWGSPAPCCTIPPILVLDEPVSGLDPHGIREVREIICRERDRGRLVFFSSHVLSEVERTADRIGIMRQGRLVFEDTDRRRAWRATGRWRRLSSRSPARPRRRRRWRR